MLMAPPNTAMQFSEREWDRLINMVLEGRVVPIIGPELLSIERNSEAEFLYDTWGRVLAEQAGLQIPTLDGTPLLYRVSNQLSFDQTRSFCDLAVDVDYVIRRQPWPMPAALAKLAQIDSFPLFITTTVDHLLERALQERRPDLIRPVRQISFRPGGNSIEIDLPESFEGDRDMVVFHLFGATSSDPDGFASTEDALIEFSWSLIDRDYAPRRLYDFLRGKTVLLLGCNFPDWLERFFIHALTTRRPDSKIGIVFVGENREPGLQEFLRRKRARVLSPVSPAAFVDELHRCWQARKVDEPARKLGAMDGGDSSTLAIKRGAVFLSYVREDKATVGAIKAQLEAANIDVWMDESGLEPGDEFQQVIHDNIKEASFFIAIISRNLNPDHWRGRFGRFFLREWKWAVETDYERPRQGRFLQPLVIDDTSSGAEFVERPFRELHWTPLQEGKLPAGFIELLSQGIRRFRRSK